MLSFTDEYRQLKAQLAQGIRDDSNTYRPLQRQINEEIVRCLWFGIHFEIDELRSVDGRRLEPLSPGWWSVEPGPDFRRAEILMEGAGRLIGDVEIHIRASDWYHHGHADNPGYDHVVLHVVMWNDLDEVHVRTAAGREVPQLALLEYVREDMPELIDSMAAAAEEVAAAVPPAGRFCAQHRDEFDPERLEFLLGVAGDERALVKADRFGRWFERAGREQALYEAVMDALGFKNNRMAFQQLARIVPVKLMQEVLPSGGDTQSRTLTLQALLYGAAGLLPEPADCEELDGASKQRLMELRTRWRGLAGSLNDEPMSAEHWQFGGTRPWNYPTRRIAAVARLYAERERGGLFQSLLRRVQALMPKDDPPPRRLRGLIKDLGATFSELSDDYWARRCRFGGNPFARPIRLIGPERATVILVNVVVPLLLAHARSQADEGLESRLHVLYGAVPAPSPNAVTRRMSGMLFSSDERRKSCVCSARHQQGLHQLYADFCGREESGCETCLVRLELLVRQATNKARSPDRARP